MSSELLGRDLRLKDDVDDPTLGGDLSITSAGDLETVSEDYNLGQAIVNRLRTRTGELADLGHALYGSRLFELIGEPNNERTRELARLYCRESVAQDPRVDDVLDIAVDTYKNEPHRIDIRISVLPIGSANPLNVVFPFYLEVV